MSIEIIGQFVPINGKQFPVVDIVDVQGGNRVVGDVSERNSIPELLLNQNSLVYVTGTSTFYYLDNGNWVSIDFVSSNNFVHVQSSLSNSWIINHNLGFYPNVMTTNESGAEICGSVRHNNVNQTIIEFNQNFRGSGFLS